MSVKDKRLWRVAQSREFKNGLVRQRTGQGRFERRFVHRNWESSDSGRGARRIFDALNADPKGGGMPLWHKLWRSAVNNMTPKERRILNALMQDFRTGVAAKIAGVSRPTVDAQKIKFKMRFAQCWRAYHAFFAS